MLRPMLRGTVFLLLICLSSGEATHKAPLPEQDALPIQVHWDEKVKTVATAATVEVDVMPHLARVPEGGSFDGYMTALGDLGAAYVRFSPWYAYPKVAVTELKPADCKGAGSSWNSTLLDGIVSDFMQAVCGPNAANGVCWKNHSVVPQLSTMPAWLYESDGINRTAMMPDDPWQFPSGDFMYYVVKGKPLKDPTCSAMAQYAARYVGWYTAGGFTDECGVEHKSGLHYDWPLLSVLNEDEYATPPEGGVIYTTCYDAWKREIAKVNPTIRLVGPETCGGSHGVEQAGRDLTSADWREFLQGQLDYSMYFLDGSHHADGQPPPLISNHVALFNHGQDYDGFFTGVDDWIQYVAEPLDVAREKLAPKSELIMNEFIPFMSDWCDPNHSGICDWGSNASLGVGINRQTIGWNAAAASFAYGFGRLASMNFKYVGNDQLIGGSWPDNEPAVASLDWQTGEPNAKYWVVRMLAELGAGAKTLFTTTTEKWASNATAGTEAHRDITAPVYALGMSLDDDGGGRVVLLVSKVNVTVAVQVMDGSGAVATLLDGSAQHEPGFQPPRSVMIGTDERMNLGPFAVALVRLPSQ